MRRAHYNGGGGREPHIIVLNKDFDHQHEAIYQTGGCGPTIAARDYKDAKRIAIPLVEIRSAEGGEK